MDFFQRFHCRVHRQKKNTEADELAKAAARNTPLPTDVFLQIISDALIKIIEPELRVINIIQGEDWRAPIITYLHHYYEPDIAVEQIRMQQRA
jgi:hypothetical protein